MSSIKTIFGIILALLVISCEGPQGPPGFDGRDGIDGQDGVNILGKVLEIEGTFSADNDYSILYEFPQTVEVFDSDVVLVYLLFDQTEDSNGDPVDIWRLLPQTRILDQGLLQYNYDFTFLDVSIFLEADFDLTTLLPGDTDNQVFRIAVVPAEFASDPSLDLSNIEAVMGRMEISPNEIPQIALD